MTAATLAREKARPDGVTDPGDEEGAEDAAKEGITEMESVTPTRVDGVKDPASGFPILMLKSAGSPPASKSRTRKDQDDSDDDSADDADGAEAGEDPGDAEKSAEVQAELPSWEDYRKAVAGYKAAEPSTAGALDATDLLKARKAWNDWNTTARETGLDGTKEGYEKWAAEQVAKRDMDPDVGGGADRDKIPASDFVDPEGRRFPVVTPQDVHDAASSYGRAKPLVPFARFKSRLTSIARRKGEAFAAKLPDKWETATAKDALEDVLAKAIAGEEMTAEDAREVMKEALAEDGDEGGQADTAKDSGPTCSKCGKAMTGDMEKCAGCGMKNPAFTAAKEAGPDPRDTIAKAVEAGLLTQEAADVLLAKVAEREEAAKSNPPLPATTDPVGEHREPDGPYVEAFEADAGLPTDHDGTSDKIPASVMGKAMPYPVLRMHDATCAAFPADSVLGEYAALKSLPEAVGAGWFATEAEEAIKAQDTESAMKALEAANAAKFLAATDPAAFDDARARLSKAFASMYPDTHLSPSEPRKPGTFQRPYLSAGHAVNRPAGSASIPPASHVPEPQQFGRGYLEEGRAARSPGSHPPNTPAPPDAGGRSYYSNGEAAMADAAMRSVHDHIASTFAGACPMSPSVSQMPPDMGARNVPSGKPTRNLPKDMGGISTVKSAALTDEESAALDAALGLLAAKTASEPFGGKKAPPFGADADDGEDAPKRKKKGGKKVTKDEFDIEQIVADAAERAVKAVAGTLPDAATLSTIAAATKQTADEDLTSRLAALEKSVAELGAQPDPAMAPVRGQMARAVQAGEPATPVEKRSPAAEALEKMQRDREADRLQYLQYLETQAQSHDPKVALRAEALLEKEMAAP